MVKVYKKIIGRHYIITAKKFGFHPDHLNKGMFALDWEWRWSGVKSKCFWSSKPTHCKESETICLCHVNCLEKVFVSKMEN